jgi:DNA-binding winged helix-turn-helix (wHTH) protein
MADTHSIGDPAGTCFSFGPFRLSRTQRLLTMCGKRVRIGSRAFDILLVLLERHGQLVSRQELMARVWPNMLVAPATLAVHVSGLRRRLRDGRSGNRYVLTIPGRGYWFVAPVTAELATAADPAANPPGRTGRNVREARFRSRVSSILDQPLTLSPPRSRSSRSKYN